MVETNQLLESKPGTINQGAEGEGWIARIETSGEEKSEGLMGPEEYKKFTEE